MPCPRSLTILNADSVVLQSGRVIILDEKLSEDRFPMSKAEESVYRPGFIPFACMKFSCHAEDALPGSSFIRFYFQIPFVESENLPPRLRPQEAIQTSSHSEIEAFKAFDLAQCSHIPRLLQEGSLVQGQGDPVPGGYICYIMWARVPGLHLTEDIFWERSPAFRRDVRSAFDIAYKDIQKGGWRPVVPLIQKLIYDQNEHKVYICGFGDAIELPAPKSFNEKTYIIWGLADTGKSRNYEDSSTWRW